MATSESEKDPFITMAAASPDSSKRLSSLETYQVLVGDISAPESSDINIGSPYQEIITKERRAKYLLFSSGAVFFLMIAAQIALCLGIAIGAQTGLTTDQISILAGVNTAVAATIGVLKGLGLPERAALKRRRLMKAAERIRITTRKLRAGLTIDVVEEADEIQRLEEEAIADSQVNLAGLGIETSVNQSPSTT
jgi:hypothetical protein